MHLTGKTLSLATVDSPKSPKDYATTTLEYLHEIFAEDLDLLQLEKRTHELIREVNDAIATD